MSHDNINTRTHGYAMRFQGRQPILGTKAQFLDFSDPGMASIDKHMTLSFWARYSGVNPEITKHTFNLVNAFTINFYQVSRRKAFWSACI